jgi:hypothetical protein
MCFGKLVLSIEKGKGKEMKRVEVVFQRILKKQ